MCIARFFLYSFIHSVDTTCVRGRGEGPGARGPRSPSSITFNEYDSDSTVIYTPGKPKLTLRTKKKLQTIANALQSGDSPSTVLTDKNYSFKCKINMTVN